MLYVLEVGFRVVLGLSFWISGYVVLGCPDLCLGFWLGRVWPFFNFLCCILVRTLFGVCFRGFLGGLFWVFSGL